MNRPKDSGTPRKEPLAGSRGARVASRVAQWLVWCRPALVSGLLLWLSFPPVGWSLLAWFALVPLATLIRTPWRSKPIYRPALAGGLLFGLLAVQWIRYADDAGLTGYYGWWALALYLGLYFPLFLLAARVAVLRFRVPAILAVPIVWVGLEYLRSWFISGFPWYFLAHTQSRWIRLIQMADLTGAFGVSFVVALVNGWLVDLLALPLMRPTGSGPRLRREQVWRLGLVSGVIVAAIAYGQFRLSEAQPHAGPRVALIQTNVPQQVKEDPDRFADINRQYLKLISQATETGSDLIIWPETAYRVPLVTIDADVTDDDLKRLYPYEDFDVAKFRQLVPGVREDLNWMARQGKVPMLMGINSEDVSSAKSLRYNSAVLVSPGGEISRPFHKIHLVPWGEYLPLRDWLPWLHIFTPHASADYGLEAGSEAVRFRSSEFRFGVLICFEDTVPWAARAYVRTEPVDFLVNISNDGWFGVADEETGRTNLWQRAEHLDHQAICAFRAVECRRPIVRAVNTGVSAIIDSCGRVGKTAGAERGQVGMASEVVVGEVPFDRRTAPFVRCGDWLGMLTQGLTLLSLVASVAVAVQRRLARSSPAA